MILKVRSISDRKTEIRMVWIKRKSFISKKIITFFILICLSINLLFATNPYELSTQNLDGQYIGKHIEYLNEGRLLKIASKNWNTHKLFKEKLLSGEMQPDDSVGINIGYSERGYATWLKLKNDTKEEYIEWGLRDILDNSSLISFTASEEEILNLDVTPHAYWLKFQLQNKINFNIMI